VQDDPEFLTIATLVGGTKPISPATYYRGVKAGRLPAPEHPTPGIARCGARSSKKGLNLALVYFRLLPNAPGICVRD
jgi:hypothetical protein